MGKEGKETSFSNIFRWTLDPQVGMISLEHLRRGVDNPVFLFHLQPSSLHSLASIDSHLCAEDTYLGQILCAPNCLSPQMAGNRTQKERRASLLLFLSLKNTYSKRGNSDTVVPMYFSYFTILEFFLCLLWQKDFPGSILLVILTYYLRPVSSGLSGSKSKKSITFTVHRVP
jgi:hypothetical protein